MRKIIIAIGILIAPLAHAQVQSGHAVTGITSAASNNSTNLKTSAAALMELVACNSNAAIRYVKLYNKATAPTCGTDTPKMRVLVPASSCAPVFTSEQGLSFPLGLGYCIVTGVADTDNTSVGANDVLLTVGWK